MNEVKKKIMDKVISEVENSCLDKKDIEYAVSEAFDDVINELVDEFADISDNISDSIKDKVGVEDDEEEKESSRIPFGIGGMIVLGGSDIDDFKKGLKVMEKMLGVKLYE